MHNSGRERRAWHSGFFAGVALGAAGVFLMAYALWPL
jgi:hypothetical protein